MNGQGLNLPTIVLGLVIAGLILGGAVLMLSAFVRTVARFCGHIGGCGVGELGGALRLVGATVRGRCYAPLVVLNVMVGRWSAASHFGNRLQDEARPGARAVYRMAIG